MDVFEIINIEPTLFFSLSLLSFAMYASLSVTAGLRKSTIEPLKKIMLALKIACFVGLGAWFILINPQWRSIGFGVLAGTLAGIGLGINAKLDAVVDVDVVAGSPIVNFRPGTTENSLQKKSLLLGGLLFLAGIVLTILIRVKP